MTDKHVSVMLVQITGLTGRNSLTDLGRSDDDNIHTLHLHVMRSIVPQPTATATNGPDPVKIVIVITAATDVADVQAAGSEVRCLVHEAVNIHSRHTLWRSKYT